jgi:anti-sigma regulatory factor (Ser/Thr protein kinase)
LTRRSSSAFAHEVLHYRGDEDFVRTLSAFVRDGLADDDAIAVTESPRRIGVLRDSLGSDASTIRFVDETELGANPARIIAFWHGFLQEHTLQGRRIRGIGEPAWPGRRDAELSECRMHEFLLNRVFDVGPAWRLLCPYDAESLPASVLEDSLVTHPWRHTETGAEANDGYRDAGIVEAFEVPLPLPPKWARRMAYDLSTLADVRRAVASLARVYSVSQVRIDDLVLASSEIAANSARHGGGSGVLRLWRDADGLQLQFADRGHMLEPLAGRRMPPSTAIGGRGVFLANQLCDLVQLRSSAAGTTARLTTWLP